ncbi:Protein of unknown function [Escherichia coli D6-117.29]|nr:Protein of unknown function [Escherichia coli D6-117.29]
MFDERFKFLLKDKTI